MNEIEHRYDDNVHIIDSPLLFELVARFSRPETIQPEVNRIIRYTYNELLRYIIDMEFPKTKIEYSTRMKKYTQRGIVRGIGLKKDTKTVIVSILRAGSIPSQLFFDILCWLINPKFIRQDFVSSARIVNKKGKVIGASINTVKVGGDLSDAYVLIPDPMGATASTLIKVIDEYMKNTRKPPKKIITAHLIITPEFIRNIHKKYPDVIIYSLRLDRGLSSEEVLKSIPGTFKEKERGLDDNQYIVPGAGGVGEIINNSFV
ncbi:MAG: uracil phosphoribosyltransferase [Deltaproteobacteria bacterium]|nr:uracil phosphoribosyltransferase [Deltaproteobacteria bacterium]